MKRIDYKTIRESADLYRVIEIDMQGIERWIASFYYQQDAILFVDGRRYDTS